MALVGIVAIIIVIGLIITGKTGRNTSFKLSSGKAFSQSIASRHPEEIPEYTGIDFVVLNDGMPCFNEYDIKNIEGEAFSELDSLGRCGTAVAKLDASMMPAEERGEIGMIKPSGWSQAKYEGIVDSDPPYLFNRCHLIAYGLSGQNANEKNLITGTRYMNASVMLPFETEVMEYLDNSDNHVLYRVTPLFLGKELVARGIEMEAFSIEDKGTGVCFHVFIYNQQPGVEVNYMNGESRIE